MLVTGTQLTQKHKERIKIKGCPSISVNHNINKAGVTTTALGTLTDETELKT